MPRCFGDNNPLYAAYHDEEWGVPVRDDRVLFEFLILEGAQAGLSWETVLRKREHYRDAFAEFDPARVARFTPQRVERLLQNPGLVRNRLKIEGTVKNARAFLQVQREFGSFASYAWGFVGDAPRQNTWPSERSAGEHCRIGRAEQGFEEARLHVCRLDDHVRMDAGGRAGERPLHRVPALEGNLTAWSSCSRTRAWFRRATRTGR